MGAALALTLAGPGRAAPADWRGFDWLVGNWTADADATGAKGGFSFSRDAGGQVLIRRNFADYPAREGRPAERHDDVMVIYRDGPAARAIYWDSEGHVIHYAVSAPAADHVLLESDDPAGPRFRLSYHRTTAGLSGAFEIAPDRQRFNPYLSWTAHRAP
jgi:hypothetical protein